MSSVDWENRIVSTVDTCHGQPRIDGTRITVSSILDNLSEGHSIEEIAKDLEITEEDIKACLNFASYSMDIREVLGYDKTISNNYEIGLLWEEFISLLKDKGFLLRKNESSWKLVLEPTSSQYSVTWQMKHSEIDLPYRKIFSSKRDHLGTLQDLLSKIMDKMKIRVESFVAICLYSYALIDEEKVARDIIGDIIKRNYDEATKELRNFENPKDKFRKWYTFTEDRKYVYLKTEGRDEALDILKSLYR